MGLRASCSSDFITLHWEAWIILGGLSWSLFGDPSASSWVGSISTERDVILWVLKSTPVAILSLVQFLWGLKCWPLRAFLLIVIWAIINLGGCSLTWVLSLIPLIDGWIPGSFLGWPASSAHHVLSTPPIWFIFTGVPRCSHFIHLFLFVCGYNPF